MKTKKVSDSLTEQVQIIMPANINPGNRLFGGLLVQWIDIVAAIVGRRHAETDVTTVAIDNLQFKAGAYLNDTLVLIGRLTHVGTTSMEVRVDTYVENIKGIRKVINRAYLTLVALDENQEPTNVPRLIIESESEKAEWEASIKRRSLRRVRKTDGF